MEVTNIEKKIRVRLDWSRMLGFDQARRSQDGVDATRLAKVGSKPIIDPRTIALHQLGSKIGIKPGIKPSIGS